jgi:hypothetical protein
MERRTIVTDVFLNREFRRLRVYSVVVFLATVVSGCLSATPETYKFETVRRPGSGNPSSTFIVRLVNVANGQQVSNAEVFALRMVFAPNYKGHLTIMDRRVALKSDGGGDFIYEAGDVDPREAGELHPGETVRLVARVAGENSLIRGTVKVDR